MAEILFYVLALLALLGAAGVVLARSPMYSVLSLLASFFALSVIYLLAGFQFMAAVQVVVYAGAILVLFLFVIMLLDLGAHDERLANAAPAGGGLLGRLAAVLAFAVGLAGLIAAQRHSFALRVSANVRPEGLDRLDGIAALLFGRYGLAFEATGVLLLITMVAVIALAKRQRRNQGSGQGDRA